MRSAQLRAGARARAALTPLNPRARRCVEFLKATDCSGNVKNGEYIRDFVVSAIMALPDPRSVTLVIQDNATRSSWPLIEEACPWVLCVPCMAHVLDLLLEDIGKMDFVASVVSRAAVVRTFVRAHTHVLSAFREESSGELLSPGATRFKTVFLGLQSLVKHRAAVSQALVSEAVVTAMKHARAPAPDNYASAKSAVIDDTFWESVDLVVAIMEPIAKLLTYCDSDLPTMSKVHYGWFIMQEKVAQLPLPARVKSEIAALLRARWDYGFSAVQGAGYVLDPEFWHCPTDNETMDGFRTMVDKVFPMPKLADDASDEEEAAHEKACESVLRARGKAEEQLQHYRQKRGVFARAVTQLNARTQSALDWWLTYGDEVPELQLVAVRCCAAVSSSSAAERGHKEMANTLTSSRNRLLWASVEDAMYVSVNQHALLRRGALGFAPTPTQVFDSDDEGSDADEPAEEEEPAADAWAEAAEEAEEAYAAEGVSTRARRGEAHAVTASAALGRRILPERAPEAAAAGDAAEGEHATRSGRASRRPAVFDL